MALIDKDQLKAEIERLIEENACPKVHDDTEFSVWSAKDDLLDDILHLLDTLPEQPVTDCHDLDSEIFAWQKAHANDDTAQVIAMTARHFAEWGMNQMPHPEDTTIFLKGVAEGKRLMMENAVSGRYMKAAGKVYVESWPLDIDPDSVKAGDEVKIIVIPEEK